MRVRLTTWLVLGLWLSSLVMGAAAVILFGLGDPPSRPSQYTAPQLVGQILWVQVFASVGALVASRRPENPIAWLLCVAPLFWWAATLAELWSYYAADRGVRGTALVLALTAPAWMTGTALVAVFGFLLFPDGQLLSPRWKPVLIVAAVSLVATSVATVFTAGELEGAGLEGVQNPIGLPGMNEVASVGFLGLVACLAAAVSSLVLRYRRAQGVERQQLKVVALTVLAVALVLAGSGAVNLSTSRAAEEQWVFPLVVFGAFAAIPVSIGVAILRYRLYDIDRVVSKTLVYGSLTLILGAAYVGLVLAGQALFSSFAGGSDLAIAVSTLAVAALFLPVRSRVQGFVDRRFYRRRYDAQRTLEAFGVRLREQVDLGALEQDLREVVADTIQPVHADVWLRGARP